MFVYLGQGKEAGMQLDIVNMALHQMDESYNSDELMHMGMAVYLNQHLGLRKVVFHELNSGNSFSRTDNFF